MTPQVTRANDEVGGSLAPHSRRGIAILDSDLVIVEANEALARLLGAPAAETLVGLELRALLASAVAGTSESFEEVPVRERLPSADVEPSRWWSGREELSGRPARPFDWPARAAGTTSTIAHDVGNYLSVIAMYADLILTAPGGREAPKCAAMITSIVRKIVDLLGELRARPPESPTHEPTADLARLVRDQGDLIRGLAGSAVDVSIRTPRDPLIVRADPIRLERALLNLVFNARDAMLEGGALTIEVDRRRVCDEDLPTGSAPLQPGDYAVLSVRDSGIGMDRSTLEHIFEPFFTMNACGRGLGLSTVHALADEAGGAVLVASQPGVGTSLEFVLPIFD